MLVEGASPLPPGLRPRLRVRPRPEGEALRARDAERQLRFLRGALTLRSTFMEVGSDDCAVARCAAGHVERAYAAGSPERVLEPGHPAPNLVPVLSDGVDIPVPEAAVDAAFSSQLIERLHPRDVLGHLQSVRRALRRGGRYFCVTSHRYCAPLQAPAGAYRFAAEALRELLAEAGFRRIRFYARIGGIYAEVPYWTLRALEALLGVLPSRLREPLGGSRLARAVLGLYVEAIK